MQFVLTGSACVIRKFIISKLSVREGKNTIVSSVIYVIFK